MGICLDLVQEDQRVLLFPHSFTGNRADLEIEVPDRADLLKQSGAVPVLLEIPLDIVLKKLPADVAYDIRLPDLPRPVDDQHFVGVRLQIVFNKRLDLPV